MGEIGKVESREKGGKAEINTGLIDSTRPHAKLYEEGKYQGLRAEWATETFQWEDE